MTERKVVLLKVLLLLSVSAPLSSAVRHCLRFYYTALTPGLDFRDFTAEGLVDGEPFVTFDSRNQIWSKKVHADDPKVWNRNTQDLEIEQKKFKADVVKGLQSLGSTGGEDTVQWMFGCGLDDDGTKTGFWELGYDGEDLISLELKNGVWTGATDQAAIIKQNCEKRPTAGFRKAYLENECIEWLQKFVKDGLSTQERKGSRKRRSLDGCKERQVAGPSGGAVPQTSGVTHSLQYFYTAVTPGINFPEFTAVSLVDGEQFEYYDRNIGKVIPKTEWIQKVVGDDPDYWDTQTQIIQATQESFKVNVETLMQRFNQSKGVHTWQRMYGCELDDHGTITGYSQYGYDGDDFVNLDMKTLTWTAPTPEAVITKHKWEGLGVAAQFKNYMENICIVWLQKYVEYGRSTLERKVPPEVSLVQKDSSSPVCHATGFFPKSLMISWEKNGVELHEDFDLRETLPNQDGSFQKRSVLTVSPEDLNRNQYTCVVQHSSLKEDIRLDLKGGGVVGIIIAVVVVLLLVVTLCVGAFLWKKKKSGFKSVPVNPNGSSDGESSSTHSWSLSTFS